MFYSPFDACEICKQYVLLDQTKDDCAREHDCHVADCPLKRFFAEPADPIAPRPNASDTKSKI